MPAVRIHDGAVCVDDQRIPLVAGEVHYWRLNPARWERVLSSVRKLGVNVVATYIPWEYHELEPGRFDFTGQTEPPRNLVGFLELLQRLDFWVFIRPGPYIYAEWTNAGVPDRVVVLPRLGEAYRREAGVWMKAVTDVLRPHFATNGGRICLFQPDNEMDLFSHWFETESGLDGGQPGFFQQCLRELYDNNLAALNAAWGAQLASFDDAQATAECLDPTNPHERTRHRDYWRFQHWATREGVRWHCDEYRRLGVDLPLVANFYPGGDVQNWRELKPVADFLGIDWYPNTEFDGDGPSQRRLLDSCRCQATLSPLPFIAEFESGVWHGFHTTVGAMTPNHYRLAACSAFIAGIKGFNWYMLVNRDNWYYSPINERGDLRSEFVEVFTGVHRVAAECDLPRLKKVASTAVVLDVEQIPTDQALSTNSVLQALYDADIDFEVFDPLLGAVEKPLMFYAGADWLRAEFQQKLCAYVENGGTLVVFKHALLRDERFQPTNLLQLAKPDRVLSKLGKRVQFDFGARPTVEGDVWVWDAPPGEPLVASQVSLQQQAVENADKWMLNYIGKQWTCGYRERRGRGSLVVLGVAPTAGLVSSLHELLGAPIPTQAQAPGVVTALFEGAQGHVLFATNINNNDVQTRVSVNVPALHGRLRVIDLWTGREETTTRDALVLSLERRSGGAWRVVPT